MIYVYGVVGGPAELPAAAGLEDVAVEPYEVDGLVLAVSRLDDVPAPSDAAVLRHAEVVDGLARTGAPVLPARFGVAFECESALEDAVCEHRAELGAALEAVRGCVELGLRVLAHEPEHVTAAATGGDYLRERLRAAQARERLARDLHEALAERARSVRLSPATGPWLLSAVYLVRATDVEDFRRQVRRLESTHADVELVCTGPWPPYSFAALPEAA